MSLFKAFKDAVSSADFLKTALPPIDRQRLTEQYSHHLRQHGATSYALNIDECPPFVEHQMEVAWWEGWYEAHAKHYATNPQEAAHRCLNCVTTRFHESTHDRSDATDARRFRWLLNGNGYFLEENMLCGHADTTDDEEKSRAVKLIDEAMAAASSGKIVGE
jgi:hypothetical protein